MYITASTGQEQEQEKMLLSAKHVAAILKSLDLLLVAAELDLFMCFMGKKWECLGCKNFG